MPDGRSWVESCPEVKGGAPVIRGTRITVEAVVGRIRAGDSIEDLVAEYPGVPEQAFRAAFDWGSKAG